MLADARAADLARIAVHAAVFMTNLFGCNAVVMVEEVGRFFAPWDGDAAQPQQAAPPGEAIGKACTLPAYTNRSHARLYTATFLR